MWACGSLVCVVAARAEAVVCVTRVSWAERRGGQCRRSHGMWARAWRRVYALVNGRVVVSCGAARQSGAGCWCGWRSEQRAAIALRRVWSSGGGACGAVRVRGSGEWVSAHAFVRGRAFAVCGRATCGRVGVWACGVWWRVRSDV